MSAGPTACVHGPQGICAWFFWLNFTSSARLAFSGGPALMANDSAIRTTPMMPVKPRIRQYEGVTDLCRSGLLQVGNRDLQLQTPAGKPKCGHIEFRRPEMSLGIVRCAYALTRNTHELGVQLAVGILVMEY